VAIMKRNFQPTNLTKLHN